ncbi:MAG: AroB-related putative sugar phosphate phospholyase (cyclizing) [Smithella sp.]
MKIRSHAKDYNVDIIKNLNLQNIIKTQKVFIVIDKIVYNIYKRTLFDGIDGNDVFLFDAVEQNKNIKNVLKICEKMAGLSMKRHDTFVSIGGGIVQDVTGFAANIYNRGIKWMFIPTTLLAQADSCIGSKTSLNFSNFKNILGTFYAPDNILIYLDFVKTLTHDDYLSGLGEVAKFNIMSAKEGIKRLEKNMDKLLSRDTKTLKLFIERSLSFKKDFIEEDEYDFGKRNLLNFAHTFGHAFETVSQYKIPHGQAVTLGLMVANNISTQRAILDDVLRERIEKICLNFISVKLIKKWFEPEAIINAMKKDKKRRTEKLAAVLFASDFSLRVVQDVESDEVEKALHDISKTIWD